MFHIRHFMGKVTFILLLLRVSIPSMGQTQMDTLKEFKVRGKHNTSADMKVNEFAPGQKVKAIDSITLQEYHMQNMAGLLSQQSPVFIKSYGFNGLATLSFRGASAAQSAVLWNGVPIQNAALGMADLSTLPVLMMNKVNIVYGGSAALWGSGNVGGALMLENEAPVFDSNHHSLSVSGGMGSFNQYQGGIGGSISTQRWYFSGIVFGQSALNNFAYTNLSGQTLNMANDHLQSEAAQLNAACKINEKNVLGISGWYQEYDRQIPPALFESGSVKNETDGSLRLVADWNRKTVANTWYAKSSFVLDNVQYNDPSTELKTTNLVNQYYQETGWKKFLGNFGQILLFVPVQVAWLSQPSGTRQQDKEAIAAAYDFKPINDRLNIALNSRAEIINDRAGDTAQREGLLLPGADASFALFSWLVLRANIQRTFREPTLNELYYFPGGNTFLRPEQGWNEDAGYTLKLKAGNFDLYQDVSVFNRDIHDWILWLGGAIWTPHNIAEVHSRGIETENNISYTTGKWKIRIGVNTAYVLATTVSSYIFNDGSIGMQIPYTPRYNGQLNAGFTYKLFTFNYNHTYTGYRFITTDESEYLLPYQTGNVQLMVNTVISRHNVRFTCQCNNIWNEKYQVVAYRPMPGINWLAGFKADLL